MRGCFNRRREELIGRNFADLFPPSQIESLHQHFGAVIADAEEMGVGRHIAIHLRGARAVQIHDPHGEP